MFEEEYNKLSHGDRDTFKLAVNKLLYTSLITRRIYDKKINIFKSNPIYTFIETYYSLFEDYLSFMDVDINKDDQDGVIYTASTVDSNHLKINVPTTLIVFALRSFYEGEIAAHPADSSVLMDNIQLTDLVNRLGLSNLSKRLYASNISDSLKYLTSYNVLNLASGTYSDPSYKFYITPAIRYVISSEKMNALYQSITKQDEEGDSLNADLSNDTDNNDVINLDNMLFKVDGEE